MIEKIINLFQKSGKDKIEFQPPIKIKMTPHTHPVWIDRLYKVKDNYMISVSTNQDSTNINLAAIDHSYLQSLMIRMHSMYG